MKTIGILGGMSAASTQLYYRELCSLTQASMGGLHSPELLIRSLDFAVIEALQAEDRWEEAGERLNQEALALERGGAEVLGLATNTMHKVAETMMRGVSVPLVHIADATASRISSLQRSRPGLMATRFTMEQPFYIERLQDRGLTPVIPFADDRDTIHRVIYDELCQGAITPESEAKYVAIADRLADQGADCLILGCTEVGLLLNASNVSVPVLDTTLIHCEALLAAAVT